MDHPQKTTPFDLVSRRQFLSRSTIGLGSTALGTMLLGEQARGASASGSPFGPRLAHFAPKAKSVIFLFMAGGPSQIDLFDPKPKLNQLDGKTVDPDKFEGIRFPFIPDEPRLLGSPHRFRRYGRSGATVSGLLPEFAKVVDDVCFIKSMYTNNTAINHQDGQLFFTTGALREGFPSVGSWVSYGLGSENADLPAFMVMLSNQVPRGGASIYGHGFLPSNHQGVPLRGRGEPVLFLGNPPGVSSDARRRSVDTLNQLNNQRHELVNDPEIATRVAAFEMAYKMQTSVPGLMDISKEPESVREMYGAEPGRQSFANNALLARRLVERGVRMVQLVDLDWDHHGDREARDIVTALPNQCKTVDRALAALITDLKQRGLLDETLVVFAGEFGRTPMNEERGGSTYLGRDHHTAAFTAWMAGGGVKAGLTYGATDELGMTVTENPVHTHDLHATILHCLGIDHRRLTYRFQGLDQRLTGVEPGVRVVHDVLA